MPTKTIDEMKEIILGLLLLLAVSAIPAYAQTATPTDFPPPTDTATPTPTFDLFATMTPTPDPTIDPATFTNIEVASNSALASSMWAVSDVVWNIGLIIAFALGILIGVFPFSFL